ncbi:hypothetical protein [Georgenia wangjunii]|uniref:hypothetical protein n=1 Tax=Georgenia wangjunii TaxID=3117730 RepID=UPI002F26DEA8
MPDGLHIPAWSGRRVTEALRRVKALGRRANAPCHICEQLIDYDLEHPHPESCTVQHLKARSTHPHLIWDPSNWAPAHASCNKSAGVGEPAGLGLTSQEW